MHSLTDSGTFYGGGEGHFFFQVRRDFPKFYPHSVYFAVEMSRRAGRSCGPPCPCAANTPPRGDRHKGRNSFGPAEGAAARRVTEACTKHAPFRVPPCGTCVCSGEISWDHRDRRRRSRRGRRGGCPGGTGRGKTVRITRPPSSAYIVIISQAAETRTK